MNAHTILGGEITAVHEDSFEDYVHASGARLKRLAFLLTGDLHQAEDVGGSDGGDFECRAGAPEIAFDETWRGEGGSGLPVRVPGPGTYTVTVEAPYCGADGLVVDNEVSTTVTVTGD